MGCNVQGCSTQGRSTIDGHFFKELLDIKATGIALACFLSSDTRHFTLVSPSCPIERIVHQKFVISCKS